MKDLIADPILIGIGKQTLAAFAEEHSIGDILRYAISRSDIDEVRCLLQMESRAAAPPAPPPAEGELAELVRELETVAEQFDQGTPEERLLERTAALLRRQVAELGRLRALAVEVSALVAESEGVAGLHLNGDIAPWDELLPGGSFERLTFLPSGEAEG